MKPRKLTETQIARILAVVAEREAIPTNAELAKELGCCKRLVEKIAGGARYKVPRESTDKPHEVLMELNSVKPYSGES